jgi:hypothetical protein
MGARGQVAFFAARYPVTAAFLHGGEPAHVEAGAKRPALTGQYYRSHAFFASQPAAGGDERIEHRGIERVHLVRPHQTNVGDTCRDRYRDAIIHESLPYSSSLLPLYRAALSGFSQSTN